MTDNEILEMALKFLDSATVSRTLDQHTRIESFRAFRDRLDMNAWNAAGKCHLFIGDVEIKSESVAKKVLAAVKRKWLAGAETGEQRLIKFRNAMLKTEQARTNGRENERGERTRERTEIGG